MATWQNESQVVTWPIALHTYDAEFLDHSIMESEFLGRSFVLADHCIFKSGKGFSVQLNFGRNFKFSKVYSSLKSNTGTIQKGKRRNTALPVVAQPEAVSIVQADDQLHFKDAATVLEETYKQQISTGLADGLVRFTRGNRRLNLRKRIILKQMKLASLAESKTTSASLVGDDIWSEEAEQLILSSYNPKPFSWYDFDYPVLTQQQELQLVHLLEPVKALLKFKDDLRSMLCREPTDDEWAEACKIDLKTLKRRLQLARAAENKLIQHNSRLVLFLARKYHPEAGSFTLEDLCQEGVKGLINALDRFDPRRGTRFSTYAIYWMRTAMLRAITRTGYIVRLPFSYTIKRLKIRKAARELRMELGRYPTHKQIMERVGLGADQYWRVREKLRVRSLDATVKGTNETLLEYLPDEGDDLSGIFEDLKTLMDAELKPKEQLVLKHRYLVPVKRRSLREVGHLMGLSPEMVRRYEGNALKKLKKLARVY